MKLAAPLLVVSAIAGSSGPGDRPDPAACSPAALAAAGAAVRAARAELSAIPSGEGDTSVSPAASRLIERTKDRLHGFVRAEMACAPASPEPVALEAAMAARGDAFVDTAPYDPERAPPDRHGRYLAYRIERVSSQPGMLAVTATLGINCGTDSMLMLYAREGGRWRELMVRRAAPYRKVSGGWGDLRFAVSPKDAQGRWFVATVSTTPWCSSAWQGLPFELARPGPAPDRASVFFRGKNTVYLGNDEDLLLEAERGAVEIRHDGGSLDSGILVRRHVRRYAVAGQSVRRTQPVAESVRDFVDEWITSPWTEARDWSGRDPELARVHARLHPDHYGQLDDFVSIRTCGGGLTQIEIGAENGPNWFFLVRGAGPWSLERVARQAGAGCTGPDRLGEA